MNIYYFYKGKSNLINSVHINLIINVFFFILLAFCKKLLQLNNHDNFVKILNCTFDNCIIKPLVCIVLNEIINNGERKIIIKLMTLSKL